MAYGIYTQRRPGTVWRLDRVANEEPEAREVVQDLKRRGGYGAALTVYEFSGPDAPDTFFRPPPGARRVTF